MVKLTKIVVCLLISSVFVMPLSIMNIDAIKAGSLVVPNDSGFISQWALNNTGHNPNPNQGKGTADADIDAPEAWDIETGSEEIIIAILDTGIDYTHPDLADNIWLNEDETPNNGIDDDGNGYVDDIRGWNFVDDNNDPIDVAGHGTLCAGIAGAVTNNGIGIAGVCWRCKLMAVQMGDENGYYTNENIADGIRYAADNGASVISMSFSDYTSSDIVKDAVDYAYDKGIVLVAAAGNDGRSKKTYPAAYDMVIAAAGTDHNDSRMYVQQWSIYSNYGSWVDVAAPGVWTYSTMPTYHVTMNDWGLDQNYSFGLCGTSGSTPHVAGLAALLLSQDPTLSNDEVKKIIRANVDPYISEYYIGTGRINAYKALTRYNNQPNTPATPTGQISGATGKTYTYTTSTVDPDGDPLYYVWDWGDGNTSDSIGPFDSGIPCEVEYAWGHDGNYTITVKATDQKGGESYWSQPLAISMPLRHQILLERIIEWILQLFGISTQ